VGSHRGIDDDDELEKHEREQSVTSLETRQMGSDDSSQNVNLPMRDWVELTFPELSDRIPELGNLGLFWDITPGKFHRAILSAVKKEDKDPVDHIVARYCSQVVHSKIEEEGVDAAWRLIWSELEHLFANDDNKSFTSGEGAFVYLFFFFLFIIIIIVVVVDAHCFLLCCVVLCSEHKSGSPASPNSISKSINNIKTMSQLSMITEREQVAPVRRDEPMVFRFIYVVVLVMQLLLATVIVFQIIQDSIDLVSNGIPLVVLCALQVLLIPILLFLSAFFFATVASGIVYIIVPSTWFKNNSRVYSSFAPARPDGRLLDFLPHITVEVPVYKESFIETIRPTLESAMAAIRAYSARGGSADILIHDDGMVFISPEEQDQRKTFYANNSISWVARPGKNRAGRFKKASNMNFGLRLIKNLNKACLEHPERPRDEILQEMCVRGGFQAGGILNLGEYVILLDSDSRVPVNCMERAAYEMETSPDIGYIQFVTTPMQTVHDYFEDMIAHFTDVINRIAFVASGSAGGPSPLVGHNAILRVAAMKKTSWTDEATGQLMFWSEDHVSEDFDMSIRMATIGSYGRLVADVVGWEEGVSLNVLEEYNRFRKYAFGTSEIILYPVSKWISNGFFHPVFKQYIVSSNIPWYWKYSVLAYMGTYYALAYGTFASCLGLILFAYSSYWRQRTQYALDTLLSVTFVFGVLGVTVNSVVRWKLKYCSFLRAVAKEFWNALMLTFFFGSVSYHVFVSLMAHAWNTSMSWSTTKKEAEQMTWWEAVKETLKFQSGSYAFFGCEIVLCALVYNGFFYDESLAVTDITAYIPTIICIGLHLFAPFLLNPRIMLPWKYVDINF